MMLGNYFKIVWRLIGKQRLYSCINVCGLALGLAACLLIGLYVRHELTFDTFFPDFERIYRVSRDYTEQDSRGLALEERHPAGMNAPAGPMLVEEFAQIEAATRLSGGTMTIWRDNVPIEETGFMWADSGVFDVFAFDWIQGDPASAMREPYSLVLTQAVAELYFPETDPLGQSLRFGNGVLPLKITGVIRDLPDNTHLPLRALISLNSLAELFGVGLLQRWNNDPDYHTYIKLAPGTSISELERAFPEFLARHAGDDAAVSGGITAMNIASIHLNSDRTGELARPGRPVQVFTLTLIALGILLIACINYVNLATARSTTRGLEVGVRKAIGAQKRQLVLQFLGESLITTLLATILALVLFELTLPWFQSFTGKELDFSFWNEPVELLGLMFLVIFLGLLAGSFPAGWLSSFQTARVLRGDYQRGASGTLFRQGLVVLQFSIAIILVIATAVMAKQMRYVEAFDLGLERENRVVMSSSSLEGLGSQWDAMKQRLLADPEVLSVSNSQYVPFTPLRNTITLRMGSGGQGLSRNVNFVAVGFDYFSTYGIELLAGRTFMEQRGTDQLRLADTQQPGARPSGSFIVNAELARQFGWSPEEALNQSLWLDFDNVDPFSIPIVGVVENSYFEALNVPVQATVFFAAPQGFDLYTSLPHATVRITGRNTQQTLERMAGVWREFLPQVPLNLHFLDTDFMALYNAELKQEQLLGIASALSIAIASLGLFGLASHNAERRTREIGVRKVMGGSVWSIVLLLTNDFSKLVLVANVIAWPVAYVAMNRWLENFAYRIDLTPLVFIGSGLVALCIAWVTVGGTAAKAASAKPVLALRYE